MDLFSHKLGWDITGRDRWVP